MKKITTRLEIHEDGCDTKVQEFPEADLVVCFTFQRKSSIIEADGVFHTKSSGGIIGQLDAANIQALAEVFAENLFKVASQHHLADIAYNFKDAFDSAFFKFSKQAKDTAREELIRDLVAHGFDEEAARKHVDMIEDSIKDLLQINDEDEE